MSLGLLAAGCSKDKSADEPSNMAPSVPVLSLPEDLTLCLENAVAFRWESSADTEQDPVSYQIQVATDRDFSTIVQSKVVAQNDQLINLEKNRHYYWRVKAIDATMATSEYSKPRSFYTAADPQVNHLPFVPELLQPAGLVSNAATAILGWNAVDPDAGDTLVYDVYFGTANPPIEQIATDSYSSQLSISIQPDKQYFWQVVVKDNNGAQTRGQVWNFRTN